MTPSSLSDIDKDAEFQLDDDLDLTSPFLRSMVSDERLLPNFNSVMLPIVTTRAEMGSREAIKKYVTVCYTTLEMLSMKSISC